MTRTTETQAADERPPASQPTLRLVYAAGEVLAAPPRVLLRGTLVVGREPSPGGLALPADARASRRHATITVERAGLTLRDEGSKNGTFLNGRPIDRAALQEGDVVRVGDSLMVLRTEEDTLADAVVPALLGVSPATRRLRLALRSAAPADITVLLGGESGTGKEVAARALHDLSGAAGPFVAVNCAAIPEPLAESQLFGHVAGAFTGARAAHPGFFRAAEGGTLFLDEVGELPAQLQPKLLRALEERAVVPVGAVAPLPYRARLVAATNRDLETEVAAGRFRGDLYARLAELPLRLPPLRARREDVLLLFQRVAGCAPRVLPRLAAALLGHDWPYNVRELRQIAAHLRVSLGADAPWDLPPVAERLRPAREEAAPAGAAPPERSGAPSRDELAALLRLHAGNLAAVARAAGRSRRQIDRWLTQHGLAADDFREG